LDGSLLGKKSTSLKYQNLLRPTPMTLCRPLCHRRPVAQRDCFADPPPIARPALPIAARAVLRVSANGVLVVIVGDVPVLVVCVLVIVVVLRLVLILAGAVCPTREYLFCTVNYCWPALKNKKLKKSLHYAYKINSYCPILLENHIQNQALSKFHITPIFLLVLYLNTKPETMGVVQNGLFLPPMGLYPRSSVMPLLATSWVTPGALCWVKIKRGGKL
jgi:hypothetical protein